MDEPALKVSVILLGLRPRKRNRLLAKMPAKYVTEIRKVLAVADRLSLTAKDFTLHKLPLAALHCHSVEELNLLREHQLAKSNTKVTQHAKETFLELIQDRKGAA